MGIEVECATELALRGIAEHKCGKRTGASVNVYLVLRKQDEVLLLLRKNTGYCDGSYGLVAGHVEDGESATTAMIREAYEEAGITIHPSCLKVVHVMHRKTNRLNVGIFFECHEWQGDIANREPEKCASKEGSVLRKGYDTLQRGKKNCKKLAILHLECNNARNR